MKYFDEDTNWIFMFCKVCWDYKKFILDKPLSFESKKVERAKCVRCDSMQNFIPNDAKNYYEHLNEENN